MKKYLLFFVFLSVHLCACEDFLDQKSQMQVDAEHMFQTEQGFKDALTQCYVGLAGDYSVSYTHLDVYKRQVFGRQITRSGSKN